MPYNASAVCVQRTFTLLPIPDTKLHSISCCLPLETLLMTTSDGSSVRVIPQRDRHVRNIVCVFPFLEWISENSLVLFGGYCSLPFLLKDMWFFPHCQLHTILKIILKFFYVRLVFTPLGCLWNRNSVHMRNLIWLRSYHWL